MSKGLGRVERQILEILKDLRYPQGMRAGDVSYRLAAVGQPYKEERPSPAVVASTYRALKSLARKGHVVEKVPRSRKFTISGGPPASVWTLAEHYAEEVAREQKKQAKEEREQRRLERERRKQEELDQEARRRDGLEHLSPDVATLAKMLGKLGSSSDEEVLVAARKSEMLRERLGVVWGDLLDSWKVDIMDMQRKREAVQREREDELARSMGPKLREKVAEMRKQRGKDIKM